MGETMDNIAKCFLILVLAFTFPSCDRATQDNKNVPLPQDAARAVEQVSEESGLDEAVEPEPPQAVAEEAERTIGMTLIPSVEPELLRNVMPNSWHRLERLTEDEEQDFVRDNIDALLEIERPRTRSSDWHYSIHRQQIGTSMFYRILVTSETSPDFMSRSISFSQHLIYQNTILTWAVYHGFSSPNELLGWVGFFESIDIIPGGESARGILVTRISVPGMDIDSYDWSRTSPRRNGQLFGFVESRYYFINDLLSGSLSYFIRLDASDALVDPYSPLRHGLQSAFDGNPSTSFMVNAENSLMEIFDTSGRILAVNRIAIINGCAFDTASYRSHNRISRIGVGFNWEIREAELAVDTISWQVIENVDEIGFFAREIYLGDKYDKVLISGFNAYIGNYGWLFGEIDE